MSSAVQQHGNDFEQIVTFYNTLKNKGEVSKYNSRHDIPAGEYITNGIKKIVPVNISCKTTGSDKVECASIKGFYHSTVNDGPLCLVVGLYKQVGGQKVFYKVYEFHINETHKHLLWANMDIDVLQEHCNYISSIPTGQTRAQLINNGQTKITKARVKNIYETSSRGLITINSKVGSSDAKDPNARRVQCSFYLSAFIAAGIPHTEYTDVYCGMKLGQYSIESAARNVKA